MKNFWFLLLLSFNLIWQTSDYKQFYKEGFNRYKKGDYLTGAALLKSSYYLKPHFKTAYYIAVCYSNAFNEQRNSESRTSIYIDSCLKYIDIVDKEKSNASKPYKEECKKIYTSLKNISDEIKRSGGTMN